MEKIKKRKDAKILKQENNEDHIANIKTIFDFFYKDVVLSKQLKKKFKLEFNNTYKLLHDKSTKFLIS